jgi:hypothetical protein
MIKMKGSHSRLSIEQIKEKAKLHGIECVSHDYQNYHTELDWLCSKGHAFLLPMRKMVTRKNWCKACDKEVRSQEILRELKALIAPKGGVCLSPYIGAVKEKAEFQCENNHRWSARVGSVLEGCWCKYCAQGDAESSIDFYQNLATSRGGLCLSENYVALNKKLKFKCAAGHIWEARAQSVKSGSWCLTCANENKKKTK